MIIASRQSDLAQIQARIVGQKLQSFCSDIHYITRPSFGDLQKDIDLRSTDSKGIFTQDFKDLLKHKECDVVVHSWKDLPIESDPDFEIFTIAPREDPRDIIFFKKSSLQKFLETPPKNSESLSGNSQKTHLALMTSSPRREYQIQTYLESYLPFSSVNFKFESLRGNIPTRFKKFIDSKNDALVMAKAAIDRLMSPMDNKNFDLPKIKNIQTQIQSVFENCFWMVLPLEDFPTAAAQGALALEVLKDSSTSKIISKIHDPQIYEEVLEERSRHKDYGGGCHLALGVSCKNLKYGRLVYSSGKHKGQKENYKLFFPHRKLMDSFSLEQIFSQTQLKVKRNKTHFYLSDIGPQNEFPFIEPKQESPQTSKPPKGKLSEFIISRYDAHLEDLKWGKGPHWVWASGNKTWKRLAQDGYWVNGSLEGLGLDHKPQWKGLNVLPHKSYWLTHKEAPCEDLNSIQALKTYHLEYDFSGLNLDQKFCFFWMSGYAFEQALERFPKIKDKIHFCGLGRSANTLKKHISEENIYYCLDELDFYRQCGVKELG